MKRVALPNAMYQWIKTIGIPDGKSKKTGWDIGYPSPAITKYMDGIADKNTAILIPGCGNAYEAEYLIQQGFTNITLIDIAPLAVENLKKKFEGQSAISILCEDFFEHKG